MNVRRFLSNSSPFRDLLIFGGIGFCLSVAVYAYRLDLRTYASSTLKPLAETPTANSGGSIRDHSGLVLDFDSRTDEAMRPPLPAARVYTFDEDANELLRIMFPRKIVPSNSNKNFVSRKTFTPYDSLDDVLEATLQGNFPSTLPAPVLDIGQDYTDSYWLSIHKHINQDRTRQFLQLCSDRNVGGLVSKLRSSQLEFSSVLEKALFQRDVYQMAWILVRATQYVDESELKEIGQHVKRELALLWRSLWLSEREYVALREMLPKKVSTKYFAAANNFRVSDDYLPDRVIRDEKGWYQLNESVSSTRHFRDFGARSFVRVYIKPQGMSQSQFMDYWDGLRESVGDLLTVTANVSPLPAGTETLLVRSFGVFLSNGLFADSGFPEEVIMRLFKYQSHRLDLTTSDYRGTMLYQYKLKRRRLLANPSSLGLKRVRESDPQFLGFFSEVPDTFNVNGEAIGTMRYNCMGCHAEIFYGANTVFSLALKPRSSANARPWLGMLEAAGDSGYFQVDTPEYRELLSETELPEDSANLLSAGNPERN